MKYKVIVHKRAARYLKSLPEFQRQRIKQSLRKFRVLSGFAPLAGVTRQFIGQLPCAPDKYECREHGAPDLHTVTRIINHRYLAQILERSQLCPPKLRSLPRNVKP